MTEKTKEKAKKSSRIKKYLSMLLIMVLVLGGFGVYSNNTSASTFTKVKEVDGVRVIMENGESYVFASGSSVEKFSAEETPIMRNLIYRWGSAYLGADGYVYKTKQNPVRLNSTNIKFKKVLGFGIDNYVGLGKDGKVYAWGSGGLGVGVGTSISEPMPILSPDGFEEDLEGVKNIVPSLEGKGIVLLTDTEAYLVGRGFSVTPDSYTTKKAVQLKNFPSFSGADTVSLQALKGAPERWGGSTYLYGTYYKIGSKYYRSAFLTTNGKLFANEGEEKLPLVEIDDISNQIYSPGAYSKSPYYGIVNDNGTLRYIAGDNGGSYGATYNVNNLIEWQTLQTGISSIYIAPTSDWKVAGLLINNRFYEVNWSTSANIQRVVGIDNKIESIKGFQGTSYAGFITLLADGTANYYGQYADTKSKNAIPVNHPTGGMWLGFLGDIFSVNDYVMLVDNFGDVYLVKAGGIAVKIEGVSNIAPKTQFVPADVPVDIPTYTISKNASDNTVVTLTYPSTADKQEYSLDGGTTWLAYTQPVVISGKTVFTFKARAGKGSTYSDVLDIPIDNDPIEIPNGYPQINLTDDTVVVDVGTTPKDKTTTLVTIVGVDSKGTAVNLDMEYTAPIVLDAGQYKVAVQIKNKTTNADLLTPAVQKDITVVDKGVSTITTPTAVLGTKLDSNLLRPITVTLDPTQGELQVQKDGAQWVSETDILNTYTGSVEDVSATERVFRLAVENQDSQYKFRVAQGANYSNEVTVNVGISNIDPVISRNTDDKVVIDFSKLPSRDYKKEYSLDGGNTWTEYTAPFDAMDGKPTIIKITDNTNGTVILEKEYSIPKSTIDLVISRNAEDKVVIDFSKLPSGDYKEEYSLDRGTTWTEYTQPFDGTGNSPITIRITDNTNRTVLIEKQTTIPKSANDNDNNNGSGDVTPIGEEDVNLTINSGGFTSEFNSFVLDTIEISTTNQYQVINSVTDAVIEDSRGTGEGWNYSIKVTDFISDPVVDSSISSNDLIVKIPNSSLSVNITDTTAVVGSQDNLGKLGNHIFNESPIVIAQARQFQGMGVYKLPMAFELKVPDKVDIVSSGEGSSYVPGEKTGLRVGTYRSIFTFTLTSGI